MPLRLCELVLCTLHMLSEDLDVRPLLVELSFDLIKIVLDQAVVLIQLLQLHASNKQLVLLCCARCRDKGACLILGKDIHWVVNLQRKMIADLIQLAFFCRDDPASLTFQLKATSSGAIEVSLNHYRVPIDFGHV